MKCFNNFTSHNFRLKGFIKKASAVACRQDKLRVNEGARALAHASIVIKAKEPYCPGKLMRLCLTSTDYPAEISCEIRASGATVGVVLSST